MRFAIYINCYFFSSCSYGFVDYATVEEAKAVFDQQEDIKVDGRVVYTNYLSPKQREGMEANALGHNSHCMHCSDTKR